jgi:hypothetical protein
MGDWGQTVPRPTHTSHGIDFKRSGSCIRCGSCCKSTCPHLSWDQAIAICDLGGIDEAKPGVCSTCTADENSPWYDGGEDVTHAVCEDFPNHPFLSVVKSDVCGFSFQRLDIKGRPSGEPLPFGDIILS